MTHTYIKGSNLYTVGFYAPKADADGPWYEWNALKDFTDEDDAAAWVSYLNGGAKPQ